jgi:RNA polymerase sigma factor (sigma-70 family)
MQEVFFALVQKLYEIEQPEYLKSWLITTARHKTIRLIEREKRGGVEYLNELEEETVKEIPDTALLTDEILTRLEREQQVAMAVASLDERCNKLLTMLYYEDEPPPYAEVAKILEIPVGSVGPTRARCLKKLMKFLPD